MRITNFPNYTMNPRGDVIRNSQVTKPQQESRVRFLQICGLPDAARQIQMCAGSDCVQVPMTDQWRPDYTHRFRAERGVPDDVLGLVKLLSKDLTTLRSIPNLDFAVVLDWYKVIEDEIEPINWKNTQTGALVNKMKYWTSNPRAQATAGAALAEGMAAVIRRHPVLNAVESVITVPGSAADGRSYGERLALTVARNTGKRVVQTVAVNGAREPRKSEGVVSLDGEFEMPYALSGGVLIIDDVVRKGVTMRAVADAARLAGADMVAGFAAVKTMSG